MSGVMGRWRRRRAVRSIARRVRRGRYRIDALAVADAILGNRPRRR